MLEQDISVLTGEQGKIIQSVPIRVDSPFKEKVDIHKIKYMSDGLHVHGYIFRPYPLLPGRKYPVIIYNRPGIGDSHKIDAQTLSYLSFLPANHYIVAATQYRGNDGSEGLESYLDKDIHDVLNIMETVKSFPYVDSERIGMIGFSRGAAVTYLLLKRQVPVKAACVMGCATNFVDAYSCLPHYQPFLEAVFHGTPQTAPEEYTSRSPVYWPEKINVPLLLIQGTDDQHVPIHQVYRLADKLKELNKVYDLVVYPEGDHTLDKVREDKEKHILEWFNKYINS